MQIDYIKVPIPKEIDEEGGAYIRLVNLLTVALGDSIKEAVQGGYVIGDAVLVTKQFTGLLKSMVEGLERDGMSRQIGDYMTVYPKFTGPVDLDKGYDPKVNSVKLGIRILGSEYEIDTKNLTFRDVTPGKLSFSINHVSSGEDTKKVDFEKEIKITGRDFSKKEELRIRVEVPELGLQSFVDSEKFTRSATVLTIAAKALSEFANDREIYGKKVIFTVLGGFNNASCASMHVPESEDPEPKLTSFAQIDEDGNVISEGAINALYSRIEVRGENIPEGIKARYAVYGTDGVLKADTSWDPLPQNTIIERVSDRLIRAEFIRNVSVSPDGTWWECGNPFFFEVMLPSGEIIKIGLKNA